MKKVQRLLSVLLVCCMAVGMLPLTAYALEFGGSENNITWRSVDGIMTFSGTGPMVDYTSLSQNADSFGYRRGYFRNNTKSIAVTEDITRIGDFAFAGYSQITSVTITDSLTSIGKNAFYNCVLLKSISIPVGVNSIGSSAFEGCTNLVDIIYGGTEAEWIAAIGTSTNVVPAGTTVHFGGTINSTPFAGGDGTAVDPYQIASVRELDAMRNYPSAHFVLVNDIDLLGFYTGVWEPIGSQTEPYTGTLDGAGYSIKNMNLVQGTYFERDVAMMTEARCVGLFGYISHANIKNLNIEIASCDAVVGCAYVYLGGLAGYATESEIDSIRVSGQILKASPGSAGWAYHGGEVGGIVGRADKTTITNSHNSCDTTIDSNLYEAYAGGITGFGGEISFSSNSGNIGTNGDKSYSGGISGAGAIVRESYNLGNITAAKADRYSSTYAGGILGNAGNAIDCYNISRIGDATYSGGIYGKDTTVTSCYSIADLEKNGTSGIEYFISGVSTAPTEEDMKNQSSFAGFDFDAIWTMGNTKEYPYPELRNNRYTIDEPNTSENQNEFRFSANVPTTCIAKGTNFELYVGYYKDGKLDSTTKDFISVISDNNKFDAIPDGWSNEYGRKYIISAKNTGYGTITVTNPKNNDAKSLELYVVGGETGYSFDGVPKTIVEEGKTTNFYNHNGLVIDEFSYIPHKGDDGKVDYYIVTMTIYNTLDLYAAVTAFDVDGNTTGFTIIDKKSALPSNFTGSVKDLIKTTGDLFYLFQNSKYYSGESISKKTDVSINVSVGGYLEISNGVTSDIAMLSNTMGLMIDSISVLADFAESSDKIIEAKSAIIEEILADALKKGFIGDKLQSVVKDAAIDELKHGNWNYDNYGERLQALLDRLSSVGLDIVGAITNKITSLTGISSITESIVKKVIPTGQLIDWLYDAMGIGEQIVAWTTFSKSANFTGIYVYAPTIGESYNSNGINIVPESSIEPDIIIHSYLVIDEREIDIPDSLFNGEYETYSITMYKNGQIIQPNATVTVRIPLSENFGTLDKSTIKVYRHNSDGTATDMNATVVDNYAVFKTDHFSYYSVVAKSRSQLPSTYIHTITFNANGGAVNTATMTTGEDGKLSNLPTPVRTNYTFDGWYTAIAGGTKITTDTVFSDDSTIYAHWSWAGGGFGGGYTPTTNPITVPIPDGGIVTVSPTAASNGGVVTITIVPNDGYELSSLVVTDKSGKEIAVTNIGGEKFTFTMPNSQVSVNAVFQKNRAVWNNPFTDVAEGAWYYDAVKFANENSLMNGVGNSLFAPNANLSRAMIAQILYNKEGTPGVNNTRVFADVASGVWYTDAVAWAAEKGIVDGYGNGLFGPDDDITREELAVMLWRYAGEPAATDKELHFSDADKASGYALEALYWAVENGIINGKGGGILDPTGQATRAETAQMLKNFLEK